MLNAIKNLPRTVWLIGLISLLNDSASELVYPLIPLYLSSVLMAGPRALGIIEGIAEATASLLKLFSGVIVDRTRRAKPWIVFGYGMAAFGRPLIALVTSWYGLLFIRFADRLGKGLRSLPRDALLAESVDASQRGLAFGLHRAMDNAGAVIGPIAASLMLGAGMAIKDIFLWALLPAILCFAFALMLKDPKPTKPKRPSLLTGAWVTCRLFLNVIWWWWPCSRWATRPTCSCCCVPKNWVCQKHRFRCYGLPCRPLR
jgi:MFS-type transporter involved in bile tolerance (Atg22 family)